MGHYVKKITDDRELKSFQQAFNRTIEYAIPFSYFQQGACYALIVDKKIRGGFCLVHDKPYLLRSIEQIPTSVNYLSDSDKVAEITGYFIDRGVSGFSLTVRLVMAILFHPAKYFVYSYPTNQTKLEEYYGHGDPIRIYSGLPKTLPGHSDEMQAEHVEVLTKRGIVKIFIARTKKVLRKLWQKNKD